MIKGYRARLALTISFHLQRQLRKKPTDDLRKLEPGQTSLFFFFFPCFSSSRCSELMMLPLYLKQGLEQAKLKKKKPTAKKPTQSKQRRGHLFLRDTRTTTEKTLRNGFGNSKTKKEKCSQRKIRLLLYYLNLHIYFLVHQVISYKL